MLLKFFIFFLYSQWLWKRNINPEGFENLRGLKKNEDLICIQTLVIY
jgi:hypothetical protein